MKKLLFSLLLISSLSNAQALFDKGVKITGGINTDNTATKVIVQSSNNVLNTIAKTELQDAFYFSTASALPVVGITDKLYITRDDNKLYRFNGTIYVPLSADVSGKEDIANKSSSFTVSSTTTYANTKALVDGLATKVSSTATNTFIPKVNGSSLDNSIISQPVATRIDVAGNINLPTANTLVTFGGLTGLFPAIGKLSSANALIAVKADGSDFVPLGYSQGNATIGYRSGNLGVIGFTNSSGNPLQAGTVDTAISRLTAGRFAFGNGTVNNTSGQIIAAKGLFNTPTDNGTDTVIVNGTISVATATQPNQAPRLEQVTNLDANNVKLTGFQEITGLKSFRPSSGATGLQVIATAGATGVGVFSDSQSTGYDSFRASTNGTGFNFVGQNNTVTTFTVDKFGVVTGTDGTANNTFTTLGKLKSRDGWASYSTTTFTNASPFTVAPNTTVTLPNNANNSITTDLPLGVTAFYNGTTNKITPVAVGDAYTVNVRFKARTTMNNDYLTLFIDIGNGSQINAEAKQFLKGANTEQPFSFTMPIFTLATFVANGGEIKVSSNGGTISIYDVTYFITRNYTR